MKNGNIVLLLVVFFLLTISVTSVTAQKDAKVIIHYDVFQSGIIYGNSPSQIIPASYLIFEVRSIAFPDASAESPVIIQIDLPADTFLTRTLATGEQSTSAPLPSNEEVVPDLAVLEYAVNKSRIILSDFPSLSGAEFGPPMKRAIWGPRASIPSLPLCCTWIYGSLITNTMNIISR